MFPRRVSRPVLVVLCALSLTASPAAAQLLGPRTDLNTGPVPRSVAVADVNEDGLPDVIATVQGTSVVSIFPGNGNLTFQPRVDVPVHSQPIALAVVDWTGDGNLDLLVGAAGDTSLTVYRGDGAGGFIPGASVKCPTIPYEIEVADVTGDGILDVVIAADELGVALFDVPGVSGGGFGTPRTWIAATSDRSRSIEVGQLDGLHGPDVYFASTQGPSQVLFSNGAGGFSPPVPVASSSASSGVALADIDLDGKLDVLEVGATGGVNGGWRVLRGTGSGGFAPYLAGDLGAQPLAPIVADFNLDGHIDFAAAHGIGSYLGVSLGSCTFLPELIASVDFDPIDLVGADLDLDGDVDFITANLSGASLTVRRNDRGAATPCTGNLEVTPTSIDFGEQPVELATASILELRNIGTGSVVLTGTSVDTPGFEFDPPASLEIPAGQMRTMTVRALRPQLGTALDTLRLTTTSPLTPALTVPLRSAARVGTPPVASVLPGSLSWPLGPQGFPENRTLVFVNGGESSLSLGSGSFGGAEFTTTTSFPLVVPPLQSRSIVVRYLRATVGSFVDTLRVSTNDLLHPTLEVPLSGSTREGAAAPSLSPTQFDYGDAPHLVVSDGYVTFSNAGELPYTILTFSSSSPEFVLLGAIPFVVQPGVPVTRTVRYLRITPGLATGFATITTDDPGTPQFNLGLQGRATVSSAYAQLDVAALDFGSSGSGTSSDRTVRITSFGSTTLGITSAAAGTPGVSVVTPVPFNLYPGEGRDVVVRWDRPQPGTLVDTLVVSTSSNPDPVRRLPLTGVSLRPPIAAVEPAAIPLVELPFGGADTRSVTIRNDGDEWPLSVSATVVVDSIVADGTASPLDAWAGEGVGAGDGLTVSPPQLRIDAGGHAWDVQADGSIATGDPGGFVGGLKWTGFPPQAQATLEDGGRTIVLGPVTSGNFELTRRVHISPTEAWARWHDTVRNLTAGPLTYRIPLRSDLDVALPRITITSSGDGSFQPADDWIVIEDDTAPAIAHVIAGPGASLRPVFTSVGPGLRVVRYEFEFTLAPGATAGILHYAVQAPTRALALEAAEALRTPFGPPLLGLSGEDRARLLNYSLGKPFSVPSPTLGIPPLSSALLLVGYDGGTGEGDVTNHGTLRITTNDPLRPLFVVDLALHVGPPDGGAVLDGGPGNAPSLSLSARFVPNPAVGRGLRLSYALPTAGEARFELYDVRGRRIASRVLAEAAPGPGMLDWSGGAGAGGGVALAPGVYWTRLSHGGKSVVTKGVVLR